MNNILENIRTQLKQFFSNLSKKERNRLITLVSVVIVLAVVAAYLLGRTTYGVLYSGLTPSEAGRMLESLEAMGVDSKTEGVDTILVPEDQISRLRMQLSAEGYGSDEFDYSIFDSGTGFGSTDQERQAYLQYQLGSHIGTTIKRMDKIENCAVIVNLPRTSSFALSGTNQPASVSVLLEIRGRVQLSASEANSIGEIVLGAVPGISKENIRIVDSVMNVYSLDANDASNAIGNINSKLELERQTRESLENQVVSLLTPVFGASNIRTAVHVELDFDTTLINSVEFEPPVEGETDGIVVSLHELYEWSRYGDEATGVPGTDTNGMGITEYPYGDLGQDELYRQIARDVNYEINETRTQIEKAKGSIKTLSIAILLSDEIEEDYSANVRNLIANAVGVSDTYISVERLPFLEDPTVSDIISQQNAEIRSIWIRELITTIIKALVVVFLALALFSLIRFIVNAFVQRKVDYEGVNINVLAGAGDDELLESMYKDINLNAKSEGIEQLEKFIDKDPQAVAQLLRNWLTDDV